MGQNQQLCKGNLGINIFTNGDFGRGNDAIIQTDPGIAPGYRYVTGLPFDGQYTIAKSTSSLPGLYGTWMSVGDQLDPNGYIMIVNASFAPGIFYEQRIDSLCPSTLYEFSADIINIVRINTTNHTLPNVSFLINDQVVFSTGAIAQNERWNKYGFTFNTDIGQTSVKLSLRNNAPGGSGNDLALDNISFRPCNETSILQVNGESEVIVCKENPNLTINTNLSNSLPFVLWEISKDSINWNELKKGNAQSHVHSNDTTGNYYYRFFAATNENDLNNDFCRVFSSVLKIDVPENTFYVKDTICDNAQYSFGARKIDTGGNYREVFKSSLGCDSIVLLDLTIVPRYIIDFDKIVTDPICTFTNSGSIGITSIRGGQPPYSIELLNQNARKIDIFDELPAGTYTINIVDRNICTVSDTIMLIDPEEFKVDLGEDKTIFLGESIALNSTANYPVFKYDWNPPELGNTQEITPLQSGTISLKATSFIGCLASDSIFVTVDKNFPVDYSNIILLDPLNFENKTFRFSGPNNVQLNMEEFNLFDRYGNLIFTQNTSIDNGIDLSKLDQLNLDSNTYVFSLHIRLLDQSIKIVNGSLLITK
jgi:hypothetical protein